MRKPRIKLSENGQYWTCALPGAFSVSCGITPKMAYNGWKSNSVPSCGIKVENIDGHLRLV